MRSNVFSAAAAAAAAALLAGLPSVHAQTFSACNPMKNTTCPPNPALGTSVTYDFTKVKSLPADWSAAIGTTPQFSAEEGLRFVIDSNTGAPTISFGKYIMFGKVEVYVKASAGAGIISSVILLSDTLDEIDWEWVGGDDTNVQSNFFGKSNTTLYNREQHIAVNNPFGEVHKYTIEWTKDQITWTVNDSPALTRVLPYKGGPLDLTNQGQNYPQTPMQVKLGNWVGCPSKECFEDNSCPTHGTCQWAKGYYGGGVAGPYVMSITNVTISDYSCGTAYSYADQSGNLPSIQGASACSNSRTSTVTEGNTATTSSSKKPEASGPAAPLNLGQGNATTTLGVAGATGQPTIGASSSGGLSSSTSTTGPATPTGSTINSGAGAVTATATRGLVFVMAMTVGAAAVAAFL